MNIEKRREYSRQYQRLYRNQNRQLNEAGGINDARELKKCTICKRYLPLSSFSHNKVRWDGLEAYCRECNVIRARQWRSKNRERMNEIVYTSMARHSDRVKARWQASSFYPIREICSIEGCTELGERHHNNYANGKDIIWLCKRHHNLIFHNNKNRQVASVV